MDESLRNLVAGINVRAPGDVEALLAIAAARRMSLPDDYVEFMRFSDGGQGSVGDGWIELWPISRIVHGANIDSPVYQDFLGFAGDGGNTVYGFDAARDAEIVEGDWIGLARDEVIPRGRTLAEFLHFIATGG